MAVADGVNFEIATIPQQLQRVDCAADTRIDPKTPENYIKIARSSFGVAHALKSKGR